MYFAIHVPDADRATTFYRAVLGWDYDTSGDYHHIRGSSPAGGIAGDGGPPRIELSFEVADLAAAIRTARELGGEADEPTASESGLNTTVRDGRGGSMALWQPADGYADPNPKCGVGDLYYFVLPVADDTARTFSATLLGWTLTPGSHPGGWNIANSTPAGGVFVGNAGAPWPYFRVDDIAAASDRVRAAGGTAGPVEPNSAGTHAACVDDQGVEFNLHAER